MEFDSKIAAMKSIDEVSTAVTQLFKNHHEGNSNSRSLKTTLFHQLKEVHSMPGVKMNVNNDVKKHYKKYKRIQFFKSVFFIHVFLLGLRFLACAHYSKIEKKVSARSYKQSSD